MLRTVTLFALAARTSVVEGGGLCEAPKAPKGQPPPPPPACANPCSPECGCLAQVGREADPDKDLPAVGVPGIPPLSLPDPTTIHSIDGSDYLFSLCGDVTKNCHSAEGG